jgi:hypothetical protein
MSFFEPATNTYPYFHFVRSTNFTTSTNANTDNPMIFDSLVTNNGSGYSTATGTFTVPAGRPGLYYFTLSIGILNTGAAMAVPPTISYGFKATISSVVKYYTIQDAWAHQTTPFIETSASYGAIIQLSAGDTVLPYYNNGATAARAMTIAGPTTSPVYHRSSVSGCLVCATY